MIYLILSIYYTLFSTIHTYINTNSKPNQALQHWNFSLYGTVASKKVIIFRTNQRQSLTVDVHSGRKRFNRDAKWSWQTILAYKFFYSYMKTTYSLPLKIFFLIYTVRPLVTGGIQTKFSYKRPFEIMEIVYIDDVCCWKSMFIDQWVKRATLLLRVVCVECEWPW